MTDTVTPPIVVSANAGPIDTLTALGRQLLLIAGAIPVLLKLLGTHDFLSIVAYFRSSDGAALIGAVTLFASMLYGLYKTHKRGAQIATVATSSEVPNRIAKVG